MKIYNNRIKTYGGPTVRGPILSQSTSPNGPNYVRKEYTFPIGEHTATLTIRGVGDVSPETFEALAQYVDLFKKAFAKP